jgi:hypothetical protein
MFMEAAQAMATRISQQPGETSAKIHDAFVRIFSRLPSPEEATSLASFLQTQEARCRSGDLKADTLTGASADPATAAWTLLIRALLNTDEFVTRN